MTFIDRAAGKANGGAPRRRSITMLTAADILDGKEPPAIATPPTLRQTLHDTEVFIRKYVVLTEEQAIIVALWAAHTHVIDAADCTPYLQITSATKRAGKTRLLEVLEPIVARPWLTGRTSAAVLVRKSDKEQPTLLLDESDAAFKSEKDYAEALRGILNSGYRCSGKASLCVGQGANLTYKDFRTFGAKAIAGIGNLPDTIADRAIAIQLRRRKTDEPCARWRQRDGHAEAAPLHEQFVAWACEPVMEHLRCARPVLPPVVDDRKAEVLEPLLAIADLAGGQWPTRARKAAVALAGSSIEDTDVVVELLLDVLHILNASTDTIIPTKELLAKLIAADDRPWATWRHDKPLTGRGLAQLLAPLGIHPGRTERDRGYRADAFDDAIARYLPLQASLRQSANKTGPESLISMCQPLATADASKTAKQADIHWGSDAMTHRSRVPGDDDLERL